MRNQVFRIFSLLASMIYIVLGLFLLAQPQFLAMDKTFELFLGILLTAYGIFRLYRSLTRKNPYYEEPKDRL